MGTPHNHCIMKRGNSYSISILLLNIAARMLVSAKMLGYYPVSLCSADNQTTIQELCLPQSSPTAQTIVVDNFKLAHNNTDRYVPRSNTYVLSVLRSAPVVSAFVDFEISDATGRMLVNRSKVALQRSIPTTSALRRAPVESEAQKGKRSGHPKSHTMYMGRRKGKGGIMGGIGGGGRYGGGSGGFRASSGGSGSRSYGYSSSAIGSRFAHGYSRTSYGYHGRSILLVGAPMFLLGRGQGGDYNPCDRYSGRSRDRCHEKYRACTANSTGCIVGASSGLVRDDIMHAAVDTKAVVFPLNITLFNVTITAEGADIPPWDTPLLLSFSEVDFDDENDPAISFVAFCFLVAFAGGLVCFAVVACCVALFQSALCHKRESGCGKDSNSSGSAKDSQRSSPAKDSCTQSVSKELDLWDVETGQPLGNPVKSRAVQDESASLAGSGFMKHSNVTGTEASCAQSVSKELNPQDVETGCQQPLGNPVNSVPVQNAGADIVVTPREKCCNS